MTAGGDSTLRTLPRQPPFAQVVGGGALNDCITSKTWPHFRHSNS